MDLMLLAMAARPGEEQQAADSDSPLLALPTCPSCWPNEPGWRMPQGQVAAPSTMTHVVHPVGLSPLETLPGELLTIISGFLHVTAKPILPLVSKTLKHRLGNLVWATVNHLPAHDKANFLNLIERDCDNLVYCLRCKILHPLLVPCRDGWDTYYSPKDYKHDLISHGILKDMTVDPTRTRPYMCEIYGCVQLNMQRNRIRLVANLFSAGKVELCNQLAANLTDHDTQLTSTGDTLASTTCEFRVGGLKTGHHVLMRTRHVVSFLHLTQDQKPTQRTAYFLAQYFENRISPGICCHQGWNNHDDLAWLSRLRDQLPWHAAGHEDRSLDYDACVPLDPNDLSSQTRCMLLHPDCEEAITRCGLPTRGVLKSCRLCYTDYMYDVVQVDGTNGEKRKPALVMTTWKDLGRGCRCTDPIWNSPATSPIRLPLIPDARVRLDAYGYPTNDFSADWLRSQWSGDIYRTFERKASACR
ncbi:hypothetical protein B0H66DRAFT_563222 [Apodospora peruviana]|uniref:F-box domain-containing protein n=1 Tax=Apodospora peruviana TaxID=516989 RepID=A0AAE0HXV7_9PEZI|nr:hypothetical protein B0H66DRAFT_563222 [Apodospora peruviana]